MVSSNDRETSVLYKAIADFTSLSKAIRQAKKELAELKAEEAAFNSSSVSGSKQAAAARTKGVDSVEDLTGAFEDGVAAATAHAEATDKSAVSTGKASGNAKLLENALAAVSKNAEKAAGSAEKAAASTDRLGSSTTRTAQKMSAWRAITNSIGAGVEKLSGQTARLDSVMDKLSKKQGFGSFFSALQPVIIPGVAALLGLVSPLIAGLGAAGIAASAFASSLGSIATAAIGIIPAITSVLSVVGALKLAFSGIGGALKAAGKTSAGGGGTNTGEELSRQQKLTRATEDYRRTVQDAQWAKEDLSDAEGNYGKKVDGVTKSLQKQQSVQGRLNATLQLAKENYANVLADPGSTKGEKLDAQAGLQEAKRGKQRGVEQAQRKVTDATRAQEDALIKLHNAQNGVGDSAGSAAGAEDAFNAAMKKLSPSAQRFVKILLGMRGGFDKMKTTVQESFFSKFVGDLHLLNGLLPPVTKLLSSAAGIAGGFADKLVKHITGQTFIEQLGKITEQNEPILTNLGNAIGSILKSFMSLAVIAGPFLTKLSGKWAGALEGLSKTLSGQEAQGSNGGLAKYLDLVNDRISTWWHILTNLLKVLWNFGKATSGLSKDLTGSFSDMTDRWVKSSEKLSDPKSGFQKYLKNVRPAITEVSKLFGSLFRGIGSMMGNKDNIKAFTDLSKVLRTKLGPDLKKLLDTLSKSGIAATMATALSDIFDAINTFLDHGGAEGLKAFWTALAGIAGAIKLIVQILPPPVITALVVAFGTLAALKFGGLIGLSALKFSGLLNLFRTMKGLGGVKGIATAFRAASGVKGKAGVVGTVAGTALKNAAGLGEEDSSKIVRGGAFQKARDSRAAALRNTNPATGEQYITGPSSKTRPKTQDDAAYKKYLKEQTKGQRGGGFAQGLKSRFKDAASTGSEGGFVTLGGTRAERLAAGTAARESGAAKLASRAAGGLGTIAKVGGKGLGRGAKGIGGIIASLVIGDLPEITKGAGAALKSAGGLAKGGGLAGVFKGIGQGAGALGKVGGRALTSGGPVGLVASVAGGAVLDNVVHDGKGGARDSIANVGSGALTGAGIGATVGSIIPGIGTAVGGAAGAVVGGGIAAATQSPEQWKKTGDDIGKWWKDTIDSWNSGFTTIKGWFQNNVIKPFSDGAKNIQDWWSGTVIGAFKGVSSGIGHAWNGVVSAFRNISGFVKDAWNNVVKGFQVVSNAVKTAWNITIVAPFKAIIDGIKTAWDTFVINPLKAVTGGIAGFIKKVQGFNLGDFIAGIVPWGKKPDQNKNSGGVIHRAAGGSVPGHGNGDTKSAMLTAGEFVIRKAVVNKIGADNLSRLNSGVLSYAQLLQAAQSNKGKQRTAGVQFGSGLTPNLRSVTPTTASHPSRSKSASDTGSSKGGIHIETLTIENAVPEPASDSLARSIRKVGYMGMNR